MSPRLPFLPLRAALHLSSIASRPRGSLVPPSWSSLPHSRSSSHCLTSLPSRRFFHITTPTATLATAAMPDAASLPKLYVYDHCPFCARARVLLGLKKIDHELIFLSNHDEATPIGLVGAKQVPILVSPLNDKPMAESMDIVRLLDAHLGGDAVLAPSAERDDLKAWIKDTADVFPYLIHPRFHKTPFAEFGRLASRDYYRMKKEKMIGSFEDALQRTPQLIDRANTLLEGLVPLLTTEHTVNASLSEDDIDLFTRLRGLSIVKGLTWPKEVRTYMEYYAEKGDIMLFDVMAQ